MSDVSLSIGFPFTERNAIEDLLRAYAASLGVSLDFQDFDAELAALPGDYAPPDGSFIVARKNAELIGCVAVRPLDVANNTAEMKRLYVKPGARGLGLGRTLATAAICEARRIGYRSIRLDTLPAMHDAQALYAALGFHEIPDYNGNPIQGTRFFEKRLDDNP